MRWKEHEERWRRTSGSSRCSDDAESPRGAGFRADAGTDDLAMSRVRQDTGYGWGRHRAGQRWRCRRWRLEVFVLFQERGTRAET